MNTRQDLIPGYKMTNSTYKHWSIDLPVYIMTADHSMFCLSAFCYLFNKFWPAKTTINVIGYSIPKFELPKNVNYISLGKDRGPEFWSDDMLDFFSKVDHKLFYLTTEDGFILRKVNEQLLFDSFAISNQMIESNKNFLRFNLTHCVSSRHHSTIGTNSLGNEVIIASPGTDYRHSLQHSIWNTSNFVSMLSPNLTPWQVELDENARFSNFDIFAFKGECPMQVGHGYSKGKKVVNWFQDVWRHMSGFSGLPAEEIQYIEKMGWIPETNVLFERDSSGKLIK